MSRLTRDGTVEPVSLDQILRRERGQGIIHSPCSADQEQDWQPCLTRLILTLAYVWPYIHTFMDEFLTEILLLTQAPIV